MFLFFEEFVDAVEEESSYNDEYYVWVTVGENQYTTDIHTVLGRDEKYPFEASYTLDGDPDNAGWTDIYDDYLDSFFEGFGVEVYEDDLGCISLFVFDCDNGLVYGYAGFYDKEFLRSTLEDLSQASLEDVKCWDSGCFYGEFGGFDPWMYTKYRSLDTAYKCIPVDGSLILYKKSGRR